MAKFWKLIGYLLLALFNAFSIWGALFLFSRGFYELSITFFVLIVLIDYFVLNSRAYPYRYMIPAVILLFILVLYPIAFTIKTAFTNYGTGHIMTRQEVLDRLLTDPVYTYVPDNAKSYDYQIFVRYNGIDPTEDFKMIVVNENGEKYIVGNIKPVRMQAGKMILGEAELIDMEKVQTIMENGKLIAIVEDGKTYNYFYSPSDKETAINEVFFKSKIAFPILSKVEIVDNQRNRLSLRFSSDGSLKLVQIKHLYRMALSEVVENGKTVVKTTLVNDRTNKPLLEEEGMFYDFDEKGEKVPVLGYISYVGSKNFTKIFTDPTVSGPFTKIFLWNFTYAALSVLFTFVIGLSFALVLNNNTLRGRTIYRTLLIIPWAIPAFISVLIWKNGFFNETYGVFNRFIVTNLFNGDPVKWMTNPFWAKVAVLIVNTWLGFPYMMTVSLGALQSIPDELYEAASIDGASKPKRFWKITFPLLMTTIAPLLVGSFAFNFNNFVNIYLLTAGGPAIPNTTTPAGATDILISYTYKLAFEAGRGQDFGFASAISILIFFIVAGISFVNFRISGSFEEVNR
ncbi:maltose transporter permease MalF [Thermosipho africanus H17ap60334]|jgi:maltose/maltodextrin transport system permease protein|uniref:Maltose/maltodextrin transport system permease protein n=1 Tax=Thermosipho africanus (strain TCF52B) TaxID=484019 RepID=B7IGE6_THEAB|nr:MULTISPECIES: ABC transporter permease subunit [Thermosipho]HCF37462.1 maltose ABC transporter permease MalF [Thermosipho africanus]ACJ75160.1 maltose transport system permease protein MalF [Thermosipho africanus TCF52B]EKF48459.1 maltose transporter permease MalF [Thermosipho africanus H17ap60334]MBZ4650739.1 maltose transport system permease protein MalF [Thermosipho sp. (in: thermotogales)]MDK2899581.1 maltose/maltodextrin transport system permease protein [Thermosipho sp. (in: thermotog